MHEQIRCFTEQGKGIHPILGFGIRVWGLRFGVSGFWFEAEVEFGVSGFWFEVEVSDLGFRISDFGFRVSGLRLSLGFLISGLRSTTTVHTMLRHTAACPYACGAGKGLMLGF